MKQIFEINENRLFYNGKLFIIAEADIKDFLLLDEEKLIIILIDSFKLGNDRNVVCYDYNKQLKWKIPQPDNLHNDNYYTSIYLSEGILHAYNINGVEVSIDSDNGEILNKQLIK